MSKFRISDILNEQLLSSQVEIILADILVYTVKWMNEWMIELIKRLL